MSFSSALDVENPIVRPGDLQSNVWSVDQSCADNQRNKHHRPIREWLLSQMGQYNLCRHSPENEADSQTEENEMVLC